MSAGSVRYEVEGGIARLVIDQPARMNAMNLAMWSSLPALMDRAEQDPSVRAVVLTGAGERAFCAGADISQFGENRTGDAAVAAYDTAVTAGNRAIATSRKPTIAVIRGICFGGGLGLAMACDLRFCNAGSRFRLPAARLGLGYGLGGIRLLVQKLGFPATADVVLSARILDAHEAERVGLVNKTWPTETFEAEMAAYLRQLSVNAPLTLMAMKRALTELARPEREQDEAAVEALVQACFRSSDYREGQQAFKEKRDPAFRGE
jgi:enoyl-CoA hydratase/carnithine racemase